MGHLRSCPYCDEARLIAGFSDEHPAVDLLSLRLAQQILERASRQVPGTHIGRQPAQPIGARGFDAGELRKAEIAHIPQNKVSRLHHVDEILSEFPVLFGGTVQGLENRLTGQQIKRQVHLAARGLAPVIAMGRKVFGIPLVRLGL